MSSWTPYGQLLVDDDGSRLQCHVCGSWFVNLAQHARRKHGLDAPDYREMFGLNRQTKFVSPVRQAQLREAGVPIIRRLRTQGKLRNWREDPERFERDKAEAVRSIREGLREEGSERRRVAWTAERRAERASLRRERNLAGVDRASPQAIREGLRRAAGGPRACEQCGLDYEPVSPTQQFCSDCRRARLRDQSRESARRRRLRQSLGEDAAPRRSVVISGAHARDAECARCGATFGAASHRDKFCPECREIRKREYQREWAHARRSQ